MNPNPAPGPVLIVDDDKKTASLVQLYMEREGFQTLLAHDGRQALELARSRAPMFIVLDLMLPLLDGWEVCREIRKTSDVPILMLTARGEEVDLISGLTLGADDYMAKPFSPRELVARVKAILRRAVRRPVRPQTLLSQDGLEVDLEKRKVTLRGSEVSLTPHEFRLLRALMAAPGRVFTRGELLDHLHPSGETVIDRVVDVHIGKLRQKVEEQPSSPCLILTVRGIGYRFRDGGEA